MSRAHGWLLCLAWMAAWPVLPAEPDDDPDPASGDEHADHASHAAAGSLPRTPIPPITAADRIAALPPKGGEPAHDNSIHTFMLVDRLERWDSDAGSGFAWQAEGWIGTDLHRAWLRSSGEDHGGRVHGSAEAVGGHRGGGAAAAFRLHAVAVREIAVGGVRRRRCQCRRNGERRDPALHAPPPR